MTKSEYDLNDPDSESNSGHNHSGFARRVFLGSTAATVAGGMLAGCTSGNNGSSNNSANESGSGSQQSGKSVIVDGLQSEPRSLNPYQTTRFLDLTSLQYMVEPLLTLNDDFEPVSLLAKDWKWNDDKTGLSFTLKENIPFHNGDKMTAEDVKASINRYLNESSLASYLPKSKGGITNIQTPSDEKIQFEFKKQRPLALYMFADGHTSIQPKSFIDKAKNGDVNIGKDGLVGTGPYKFEKWKSGNKITLSKFDDYNHGPEFLANTGPAKADRYEMNVIPEATTRVSSIQQGDTDITFSLPPKFINKIKGEDSVGTNVDPAYGVQYMACNAQRGPTAEKDVRVAIAHAVNKKAIVKKAWSGVGDPIPGLITKATTGYWPGVSDVAYEHSQQKARQRLENAGWTSNGNGTRTKDGKPLQLQLITFSSLDQWRTAGTLIQNQLKKVGIDVTVDTAEVGAIYDRGDSGDYHLIVAKNMWWFGQTFLNFLTNSENIGAGNYGRLKGPVAKKIDENLAEAQNALDRSKRQEALANVQRLTIESAAWLPLVSRTWRGGWGKSSVNGVDEVTKHPWWPALSRALDLSNADN